jgi:uncharacterized protein
VLSDPALQEIADELQAVTDAGRTTIRVDVPGDFFPIAAETLTPGVRSFRDYSMAWVRDTPTPIYDAVSRQRKVLVQTDCAHDERPPPIEITRDYGVQAQMIAPVVSGDTVVAMIAVHELRGPREWSREDVAALDRAVARVAQVLRTPTGSPAQNAACVRAYMTAFLSGDIEAAQRFLAEDVTLNVPGRNPLSGRYEGSEATCDFLRKMGETTRGSLEFDIVDVLANEQHVVVLFSPSARRPGKEWDSRAVTVYRLRDGAIDVITVFQQDLYAFDAFMS